MKTLIRNVKLFDGTALAPRPMDVLFDESGILAVKEAGAAPAAADAVVDGTGKTLSPGLIDGHVHLGSLSMSSPTDPKGHTAAGALIAAQVQDLRRWGITAVRNCGTGVNADLVVRDMIPRPDRRGPDRGLRALYLHHRRPRLAHGHRDGHCG